MLNTGYQMRTYSNDWHLEQSLSYKRLLRLITEWIFIRIDTYQS
jgi:hypothetical protein